MSRFTALVLHSRKDPDDLPARVRSRGFVMKKPAEQICPVADPSQFDKITPFSGPENPGNANVMWKLKSMAAMNTGNGNTVNR